MAIAKRPVGSKPASNVDEFIAAAPDAAHEQTADATRRRKEVISLGIDGVLLKRVDAIAVRSGLSRAAAISLAIFRFADAEEGRGA